MPTGTPCQAINGGPQNPATSTSGPGFRSPGERRAVAGCEIVVDFVERHAAIRIDPVGLGDVDQALRGP